VSVEPSGEHLLDHALEPALAEHIARLKALLSQGDEVAAAEEFFDFRCVDLAMGSGHFLVAAVDRIEARLSGFLALHPIAPVVAELEQLRQAAVGALGDLADGVEIETTSLLRRQVARFTWRADLPPALGDTNGAPSPTALLLSALAGCAVVFVRDTLAPQLGIRVDAVEATVKCDTDARGLLGMNGAEPDLRNLSLEVSVGSPDGDAAVKQIADVWQERCPIYLALIKPTDIALSFRAA
jgi:uncharacterized OsmC-like protein